MDTRPLHASLPVGRLARAAVRAAGDEAARWAGAAPVDPDPAAVTVAYTSERWMRLDDAPITAFAPLSGFFRTRDGWVRTHANYPHHARALRSALGIDAAGAAEASAAADDAERVRERLATLSTAHAEASITAAGGLCVAVVPAQHATDERLRASPAVSVTRIGEAAPRPGRASPADAPLRGIRVLDLTRVIAGPVATRTLALLGADVLRVDSPRLPEPAAQHLDTGQGKRSTLLDLDRPADRAVFRRLAADADAIVLGYRPAALTRLDLSPDALAALRPGVVVVRLSAWGESGGRGFDSLVQAASGISWIESTTADVPGALPAQALDHTAGYLLAAHTMATLRRRRAEGGSWLVETSLRRIAAELLGMPRARPGVDDLAPVPDPDRHLQRFTVRGRSVVTAAPAIAYAGAPLRFAAPREWGGDAPAWLPR
ncbi:CoA transferase [Microbacterium hominis]|uniref:CoA transferase n=1 Tax=Microbacterium hominis TaxID=162426 RepID=UPI00077C85EA|nr:CoA transferase [Microbacterium hominis]